MYLEFRAGNRPSRARGQNIRVGRMDSPGMADFQACGQPEIEVRLPDVIDKLSKNK